MKAAMIALALFLGLALGGAAPMPSGYAYAGVSWGQYDDRADGLSSRSPARVAMLKTLVVVGAALILALLGSALLAPLSNDLGQPLDSTKRQSGCRRIRD